ncbi:MAG: hypothetical protein NTW49_01840 [Bacteroidia bacterium]|nr:hypothetical protein [Bacteroidia bacterium]
MKRFSLIFAFIIACIVIVNAQSSTTSPYSRFGLGDLSLPGFGQNIAMGGTGIGIRNSYHINMCNPASYTSSDSLSFIFENGVTAKYTRYETLTEPQSKNELNYSYLAIEFPVKRWWAFAVGLIPYSNVGYSIMTDSMEYSASDTIRVQKSYVGEGGINQLILGTSFKFLKHFSFGINASYMFGSLNYIRVVNNYNANGTSNSYMYNFQSTDKIIVSDINFLYGVQYSGNLNKNTGFTIGLIYGKSTKISAFRNTLVEISNSFTTDTITNVDGASDHIVLPTTFGAGFSIYNSKLIFAADYSFQNWSKSTVLGLKDSLANSNRISFGLQFLPDERAYNSYFKRIEYRIGGHYSDSYISLRGEQLKDASLSIGLGFPLRRTKSSLNVSFEFGERGTTDKQLIKETYGILHLNLSLHDFWFIRRKFD